MVLVTGAATARPRELSDPMELKMGIRNTSHLVGRIAGRRPAPRHNRLFRHTYDPDHRPFLKYVPPFILVRRRHRQRLFTATLSTQEPSQLRTPLPTTNPPPSGISSNRIVEFPLMLAILPTWP